MSTTRVRIGPDDPSTLPKGRIDPARVDATTEAEIAAQEREDETEGIQNMARPAASARQGAGDRAPGADLKGWRQCRPPNFFRSCSRRRMSPLAPPVLLKCMIPCRKSPTCPV